MRSPPPALAGAACAIALALSTSDSGATPPPPNGPDWAFGAPVGEAVFGGVTLLSFAAYFFPQQITAWAPSFPRPRDDIYGNISDFTGAVLGSMIQIAGGYAFEAAYYDENAARLPLERAFRTSLVDIEALILSNGINVAIKRFSGRCRPRAWQQGNCGPEEAEFDAFPSGHTTPVAAIASSHLVLALRSNGQVSTRYAAFGFGEASALLTASLRVLAGAHSWEDVLGGWAIGTATGAVVALVHPMIDIPVRDEKTPLGSEPAASSTVYSWSGSF
jgi:membrane-associated phospholipid phosphatase